MNKRVLCAVMLLGIVNQSLPAVSESDPGEVIVTATRVDTQSDRVASSVTVITADDLVARQYKTVPDVLQNIPGVHISRNGTLGKSVSIYLRGAKSEHVLVLMDGVEVNDPMGIGRGADLSNIGIGNVEKIEVLRGSQSALYGSDAIGGVINIITKKGEGPVRASVTAEAGSFETYHEAANISGASGDINYAFSLGRIDSEGISNASEKNGNTEKDGYWNTSLSGRMGWTPSDKLSLDLFLRYIDAESELDEAHGGIQDTLDYTQKTEEMFIRSVADFWMMDSIWEQKLGAAYSSHDRAYDQPGDHSVYDSELLKFDWQNNLFLSDSHVVTVGVEYEEEQGESVSEGAYNSRFEKKTSDTTGIFAQEGFTWRDKLTVSASARLDRYDKFGEELTYRLAPSYQIPKTGTRFKTTYGTGFKTPSLYQLYSPYGNENLDPMDSKSFDIGVSQNLFSKAVTVDIVYFDNRYEDMIAYDYTTSLYGNISEAESKGVEIAVTAHVSDDLTLNACYTYTDTEDKDTGGPLKRIPEDRISAGAGYRSGKLGVSAEIIYVGSRQDRDFLISENVVLPDYVLVNIAGSYDFTDHWQAFGRIENLLDEDYEDVLGYGMPGLGAYAGVKMTL